MKCDVHLITCGDEREDWLDQCVDSLTDQPVNIHFIEGTESHIGKGRAAGFAKGSSPFVSFVDPDDFVHPGAFDRAITHLTENPELSLVCSAERRMDEDGNEISPPNQYSIIHDEINYRFLFYVHHLVVVRRSAIEPYLSLMASAPQRCEYLTWFEMWNDGHKFGYIDSVDYSWRVRENSAKTNIPSVKWVTDRMNTLLDKFKSGC